MIDLDLLDIEAHRKSQTFLKQYRQEMLESTAAALINEYFHAQTLEDEQGVLLGKYPLSKAGIPNPTR